MAANVVGLSETNGTIGSPTTTDTISNINFGSVDSVNLVTASHKIIIGTNSYAKWIRFQLITNNNTSDANIRVFKSAGTYVTGETINSNCVATSTFNGLTINTYGHNVIQNGNTALSPMPFNGAIASGPEGGTATFAITQPAAENLTIGAALGATLTTNGTYSNYGSFQLTTTASTPAGAVNTKTFSFVYDEV